MPAFGAADVITGCLLRGTERSGTVWFATPELALTAAHCVGDRSTRTRSVDPLRVVNLNKERQLTIIDVDFDLDVALLATVPPVPKEACAPLDGAIVPGSVWWSHGYPDAKPDGLHLNGRVDASHGSVGGAPALQLTCEQGGFDHLWGCSGAPVVCERGVIGLIRWAPPKLDQKVLFATRLPDVAARFPQHLVLPVAAKPAVKVLNAMQLTRVLDLLLPNDLTVNLFAQSYAEDAYNDFGDNMPRSQKIGLIARSKKSRERVMNGISETPPPDQEAATEIDALLSRGLNSR